MIDTCLAGKYEVSCRNRLCIHYFYCTLLIMQEPVVGIIMGSDSDLDIMSQAAKVLDEFGVANEVRVLSAHRTPDETSQYVRGAAERGLKVIIAGAGGSAHLAGVTAAQ